jgi:hypothetical protein
LIVLVVGVGVVVGVVVVVVVEKRWRLCQHDRKVNQMTGEADTCVDTSTFSDVYVVCEGKSNAVHKHIIETQQVVHSYKTRHTQTQMYNAPWPSAFALPLACQVHDEGYSNNTDEKRWRQ